MPDAPYEDSQEQKDIEVVVYAPVGRDQQLIGQALSQAGILSRPIRNVDEVCDDVIHNRAAVAILAEEALPPDNIRSLQAALRNQPPWSDLPLIVLTSAGAPTGVSIRRFLELETLGHVTLLERPLRSSTLIAAVRSAVRTRLRQLQIRDYLADRLQAAEELARQARELARSNADLQQFAYITSHDLREPLRNIALYAQLLRRRSGDRLNGDGHQYLSVILQSAERMEMLTDDLLSYSRVLNTNDIPLKAVPLDGVLAWAKANLERAIAESGTEITSDPLPEVVADEVQMVQLFQNLLSNAIKYRRRGVVNRIHVAVEPSDNQWRITFRDNGQGFEPEYADRIFGLFKRLHGRDIPGTGIGLAICKTIVERHGGTIQAESTPGVGTAISVTLPRADSLPSPDAI